MSGDGTGKRALTTDIDARDPSWNASGTRLVYDVASNDLYTLRVSDGQDRQQLDVRPSVRLRAGLVAERSPGRLHPRVGDRRPG